MSAVRSRVPYSGRGRGTPTRRLRHRRRAICTVKCLYYNGNRDFGVSFIGLYRGAAPPRNWRRRPAFRGQARRRPLDRRAAGLLRMRTATGPVAAYLARHSSRLSYADRLARGRLIGFGSIEGERKQPVNRHMKRTDARRGVVHLGPSPLSINLTGTTSGALDDCRLRKAHPMVGRTGKSCLGGIDWKG